MNLRVCYSHGGFRIRRFAFVGLVLLQGFARAYIKLETSVDPAVFYVIARDQSVMDIGSQASILPSVKRTILQVFGWQNLRATLLASAVGTRGVPLGFILIFVLSVVLGMTCGVIGSWLTTEFSRPKPDLNDYLDDTPTRSTRRRSLTPLRGPSAFESFLQPDRTECERLFHEVRHGSEDLFFRHVRIRPDGGLRKEGVGDFLFGRSRVFQVSATIVLTVFNIWVIFYNFSMCVFMLAHTHGGNNARFVIVLNHASASSSLILENLYLLIALVEIAVVAIIFVYISWIFASYNIFCTREDLKRFRVWHQLYTACCRKLPELSTFSAMKPLEYMNPQRLFPRLQMHLVAMERGVSYPSVLIPFAVTTLCLVIFGFAAFVVKFTHLVSTLLEIVETQTWSVSLSFYELTLLTGFINQVFGITEVGEIETQRIFMFIFGGEGVTMTLSELDKQEVFLATVFHNVGTKLWVDDPPLIRKFKRAVAMLSFDHLAIQSLVLEENQSMPREASAARSVTANNS
eukprot:TRINITY_DN48471_c0_g1_i1.p1 TRINITY_DN48471_c0_g1~~TRINITY_DN48471_c0_g1_i1.p1  ORF type:complete len:516 (+),score=58.77 TRINITY_DN48471_c0_g1_i1:238-1785(+)